MRNFIVRFVSTCGYVGYLPLFPGTWGSAVGVVVFLMARDNLTLQLLLCLGAILLGFLTSGRTERIIGIKDPKCVVIDEVAGMLITLFALPARPGYVIVGFLLFRLFDTLKPYPAYTIQQREGSLGIMADDLIAAVYANVVLQMVASGISLMGL